MILDKMETILRTRRNDAALLLILDIGCGGGVSFDDFSRFGEVYGLEPDPILAESLPRWPARIEATAGTAAMGACAATTWC